MTEDLEKTSQKTKTNRKTDLFMVLTPFSTIFQIYHGQFYWCRKPEYLEKTTKLSQVTVKLLSYILNQVSDYMLMGASSSILT
jgi:hypothetical protein